MDPFPDRGHKKQSKAANSDDESYSYEDSQGEEDAQQAEDCVSEGKKDGQSNSDTDSTEQRLDKIRDQILNEGQVNGKEEPENNIDKALMKFVDGKMKSSRKLTKNKKKSKASR